jgi:riboflavin kinase/FMN adenylyltransferase
MSEKMNSTYAATVGFFDGVHSGHRFLIDQLKAEAAPRGLKTMIITFGTHPRKVLHDSFQPQLLTSYDEKLRLLKSSGVDRVEVLDFTLEMARMTAQEFISDLLAERLNVKLLLVGHDHRFGRNREDGFPEYKAYGQQSGMEVIQAERFSTGNHNHISSSVIRKLIENGQLPEAGELLGYTYEFTGKVVSGYQVGRKIGFPTANLQVEPAEKLIPGTGVYAVEVEWQGHCYPGMMNIGYRPTIGNARQLSLEVHIIEFGEDIYNQLLKVRFLYKIREEKKFDSLDALILQLKDDKMVVMNNLR